LLLRKYKAPHWLLYVISHVEIMKVHINKDLCLRTGACVEICPEIFTENGNKIAAKTVIVPDSLVDICRDAAEACPSCAIILED
jgi:ferredoxin